MVKQYLSLWEQLFLVLLISYSTKSISEEGGVLKEYPAMSESQKIKAAIEEMDKLEKQLEQNTKELNKRPRRLFVGARTKNYQAAQYMEIWQQKVEKVGNESYPKAAADEHLLGKVRATVSIMEDGTVEKAVIDKSSGHKILDDHVIDTIKKAAPYKKFSDELKKDCDIISMTRTWTFTQEDVESEGDISTKPAKDDIGGK